MPDYVANYYSSEDASEAPSRSSNITAADREEALKIAESKMAADDKRVTIDDAPSGGS